LGQPDPPALPTSYDISDLLAIVPTSDCVNILKNLRWSFRSQGYGGDIFANVVEDTPSNFQTQLPINQPYRLTFWLVIKNEYFTNFTNLALSTIQNQIYYFSNLNNNKGYALFLTKPLLAYTANTEYRLGQMVTHGSNTLESLHYGTSAGNNPNNTDWNILPNSQYVSDRDRLLRQSTSRTQIIQSVNPKDTFRFTLVDVNARETFVFEVTAPSNHQSGSALSVNLNFRGQVAGRYRLILNGIEVDEFILTESIPPRNAFALVEIVLNPDLVSPAFSLLESNAVKTLIRPKTYVIRFKNRATRWRYRYEKDHGFAENELPKFDLLDDKTYATKLPLGLCLRPTKLPIDGKGNLLPAPSVRLIKPEIDPSHNVTNIFSDIHL
jgi:hypothetical protein